MHANLNQFEVSIALDVQNNLNLAIAHLWTFLIHCCKMQDVWIIFGLFPSMDNKTRNILFLF